MYTDGTNNFSENGITYTPYYLQVTPPDTTTYSLISVIDDFCSGTTQGTGNVNVVPAGTSTSSVCQFSNLYGDADENIFGDVLFDQVTNSFFAVGRASITNNKGVLVNIDNTGSLVWQQEYPGVNYFSKIEMAPNGDLMLFRTQGINGSSSVFEFVVTRVNNTGNFIWSKTYTANTRELNGRFVHIGNDEYVISSMHLNGSDDALFLKLDGAGNIMSTRTYHQTDDQLYDMIPNGSGGVVMIGGLHGGGRQDKIVIEFDGNGAIIQSAEFEGTTSNFTEGYIVRKTKDGGFITLSKYFINSGSNHDLSLMKLDAQMNIQWEKTIVQNMSTSQAWNIGAWDIEQDNHGGYYVSIRDWQQTKLVAQILKFDSLGIYKWAKEFPSFTRVSIQSMNTQPTDNLMLWSSSDAVTGGFGLKDGFFAVVDTSINSCLAVPVNVTVYSTNHTKKGWSPTFGTDTYTASNSNITNSPVSWSDYYACQPCNVCDLHVGFNFSVGCPNDTVVFIDNSIDSSGIDSIIMWIWAFGDGDTLVGDSAPKHVYQNTGTYSVTLIVGNSAIPICYDTIIKTIIIGNVLKIELRSDTTICISDSVKLDLIEKCAQGPYTYTWSPTTGLSSSIVSDPMAAPSVTTTYYVTVTDFSGSVAVDSITITVDQTCCRSYADFLTNKYFCFGELLKLSNTSIFNGAGVSYFWDFGNAASPPTFNGSTPSNITISSPGSYTIVLILNDACGSDTAEKLFSVFPLPTIELGNDTSICFGDTVFFEGNGLANYMYSWSPINIFDDVNAFPNSSSPENSVEIIIEVVDKDVGCSNQDTLQIDIFNNNLNLGEDTIICIGDSLLVIPSFDTPILTYLWNDSSTASARFIEQIGLYWLQTIALNGCEESDTLLIKNDSVVPVNLGNDTVICLGNNLELGLDPQEFSSVLWQGGSSSGNTFVVSLEGDYNVIGFSTCGQDYDTISVEIEDCACRFYVPNSFTPDGDGLNDLFKPSYSCVISNYTLRIFDRWGDLLFETNNIDKGWDGTKNSTFVQGGVYVYDILYRGESYRRNNSYVLKGHVTLLR